jgi:hypothetical protein
LQRKRLRPVFAAARASLEARGFHTWPGVFTAVTRHFADKSAKPSRLSSSARRRTSAHANGVSSRRSRRRARTACSSPATSASAFSRNPSPGRRSASTSGDALATLKVNDRTSHQIRGAADRPPPGRQRDVDGGIEERKGAVSVFGGPAPKIVLAQDEAAETSAVAAFIKDAPPPRSCRVRLSSCSNAHAMAAFLPPARS